MRFIARIIAFFIVNPGEIYIIGCILAYVLVSIYWREIHELVGLPLW